MLSRRFRPRLVALALLGLGSCDLNPQPDLPVAGGSHDPATPGPGYGEGPSAGGTGNNNGSGGSGVVLEPGMSSGGTDTVNPPDDKGAGGAGDAEGPSSAGAGTGGASDGGAAEGGAAP